LPKGHLIFHAGTPPAGLFYLNRGKVKVYKTGEDGKKQIVRLAKNGDILGYRALISGKVYSVTAETLDNTCLCFIPQEVFFEILTSQPEIAIKVMRLLTNDLETAEQMILDLAQRPVRERVALSLLALKQVYGVKTDGQTLDVELSREDIANMVGTATESVIRLLSEFRKDGLIEVSGRKIKVLDEERLLRAAYIFD